MKITKITKDEKGFTGQDILISIFIVTIFLSLMGGIFINLSKTSKEIRYTAYVTDTFTKVAERVDKLTFDEVSEVLEHGESSDNIGLLISTDGLNLDDPNLSFRYYILTSSDATKETQEITVVGKYTVSGRENTLEVKFKKVGLLEMQEEPEPGGDEPTPGGNTYMELQYPFNPPQALSGYKPIKHVWKASSSNLVGYWVSCEVDDPNWYSVEEGNFPMYTTGNATNNVTINNKTYRYYSIGRNTKFYMWIPRICDNNSNFTYAWETSNQAIEALSSGGYKIGEDKGAYTAASTVYGNSRGFLQTYKPYNGGTFDGNNYTKLPSNLISLIQSFKYRK